ncbi:hypothetical protein DL96DRAFT_1575225 [Flagelloscypha sp. PMI_526]|nr:hypothetical protein DL96DRAFT_1575225 [Flagelloscypha sp. PMI_526]
MANPHQYAYSSHYAQAYMQAAAVSPSTTNAATFTHIPPNSNFSVSSSSMVSQPPLRASMSTWYTPGSARCPQQGCSFYGSANSVETHLMDRHLIFPIGWEKRAKKADWDADPSLKGKRIPIQGTSVNLDDPEVLAAWIAERKKRWPTQERVAEKKRKLEEALESGQLPLQVGGSMAKRNKPNPTNDLNERTAFTGRGRGKGDRGGGRGSRAGRGAGRGRGGAISPRPAPVLDPSDDDDDDAPPEAQSSKVSPNVSNTSEAPGSPTQKSHLLVPERRSRAQPPLRGPAGPKAPPRNPYAVRPTLLRNLLLPEIRMTVSNLSQAIRFIVDNNFFESVEVRPGQASELRIQVLEQTSAPQDETT